MTNNGDELARDAATDTKYEVSVLQNDIAELEDRLNKKNEEIQYLHQVLRDRESSVSWRFSQFYGRFFKSSSIVTRSLSFALNKALDSRRKRSIKKLSAHSSQLKSTDDLLYFGEIPGKVSVILPVYNQADLLDESIKSVLAQTYDNFELIIINDGSKDDIYPVLDKYVGHPKVLILTQENQKLPSALNNGFRYATGEYYTWTSADNIMMPDQLYEQVKYLREHPDVDMVYCDYEAIDDRGKPLVNSDFRAHNQDPKGSSFIHLPRTTEHLNTVSDNFIGACFMYRSYVAKAIGDYDLDTFGCEDYDYWMRINSLFNIQHIGKNDILYRYRVHDNTLNARAKELGIFDRVYKLMQYDANRRQFFSGQFDMAFIGQSELFQKLFNYYKSLGNNVFYARRLKDIKGLRRQCKCIAFVVDDDEEERNNDVDTFIVRLLEKEINEYNVKREAFDNADLLLSLDIDSYYFLSREYPGKAAYLPGFNARSASIVTRQADSKIYYRLSRHANMQKPPGIYFNNKLNVMIETETLDKGGLEQVILDLATNLDKRRMNVYIACIKKDGYIADKCRKNGIDVFLIKNDPQEYEKLLRNLHIDVINSHYSLFGAGIASRLGIPVVSVIHNNYAWLSEHDTDKLIDTAKGIKQYIAVSKNVSRYSRYYYHISPRKIEVIQNGIDIEAFNANSRHSDKGRENFGLKDDDYVFLNVAAYDVVKGHNLMLSAMAELVKEYPKIKLVCVGSISDPDYYKKLMGRVKAYGLEKNVTFTGFVPLEDLYNLYKLSDAFILPSLIEGWSMSLMEAMLNGLPIIVTDVGASQELVKGPGTGIVIPNAYGDITNLNNRNLSWYIGEERPTNTGALVDAMKKFYANDRKWAEAGKLGIDLINSSYNIKQTIKEYEELFIQSVYVK